MPLYSNFFYGIFRGDFSVDWDTDTIKVALFSQSASSFVTATSAYTYWSQIGSGEITGTGYTASGQVLSSPSVSLVGYNPTRIKLTGSNISWESSTLSARYAVLYKWTGNPATSPLICHLDFGEQKTSSNGPFSLTWASSGIIVFSTA